MVALDVVGVVPGLGTRLIWLDVLELVLYLILARDQVGRLHLNSFHFLDLSLPHGGVFLELTFQLV